MTAKIYDFNEEHIKRTTVNCDFGEGDETVYSMYMNGTYMKLTVEEFERLNESKPLSIADMNRLLEDLGAETLKDK